MSSLDNLSQKNFVNIIDKTFFKILITLQHCIFNDCVNDRILKLNNNPIFIVKSSVIDGLLNFAVFVEYPNIDLYLIVIQIHLYMTKAYYKSVIWQKEKLNKRVRFYKIYR